MSDIYTSDDMRRALEIAGPVEMDTGAPLEYRSCAWGYEGPYDTWYNVPRKAAHALINEHLRRWLAGHGRNIVALLHWTDLVVYRCACRPGFVRAFETYEHALVAAVLAQEKQS